MNSKMERRVLIVEAAPIFKSVLTELATCAYQGACDIRTTNAATMETQQEHPDVVIRMLTGSAENHLAAVAEIERTFPFAKGIYFCEVDPSELSEATQSGKALLISRDLQFANIINEIARFEMTPENTITSQTELNEHQSPIKYPGADKPMTKKQVTVMEFAAQGLTVKETARQMDLSPDTIKAHMKQACERLKARNKAHAICNFIEAKRLAEHSSLMDE